MKKNSLSGYLGLARVTVLSIAAIMFLGTLKAQTLAEWPLLKVKTGNAFAATNVASGVTANPVVLNDSFVLANYFGATVPATTGLRLKQSHAWPGGPTPLDLRYAIDFPISPAAGNDLIITGLSLEDSTPTSSGGTPPPTLSVIPYYQIDGKGNWTQLANAQSFSMTASTNVNFGKLNIPFFYNSSKSTGHTYSVRLYFYSTDGAIKGDVFYLANVTFYGTTQTARTTPTIKTISAVPSPTNGKYVGVVTGSYDFGTTYQNPTMAGVAWSTSANPDISSSFFTTDGASGIINSNIAGLAANTLYHARAYIVTPIDTLYGQDLTFTTDNYTAPAVTTVAATSITSIKATVGGIITDSGGTDITNKMINYSTSPSLSNAITIKPTNNTGSAPYSVVLTQLKPNTQYYYQACATNSISTSCGSIATFTTTGVVPTLAANPYNIDFGDIIYNSPSPVISYTLTGNNLTPASGTITLNISPAKGFIISTSSTAFPTAPVSTITIPYSGGAFKKSIFIKLLTNNYGTFTSTVVHSGGGVAAIDADTLTLRGNIIPSPDKLSNMGTDFWTGFGCEENMKTNTTQFDTIPGSNNAKGAHFSLYIATGNQPATVLVDMPGLSGVPTFPRTVNIPANSVTEVGGFPVGDGTYNNPTHAPDSRLYYTGVSNRGIHVTSTTGIPIACWLYDWATNNSAAGAMLFPTNTWNSSYSVQAYGGTTSNTGVVSSYFFVIANDDNTVLTITPTADIIDSATNYIANKSVKGGGTILHPKGITYYVTLPHKGDVYNAIGLVDANSLIGYDLTGTKISTDCSKKIAVFGGNSRTLINTPSCSGNTSGSDNLIQQMFPKVAWGTKYLTVPTKNMEFNTYRVSVEDAATVVKVNGSPILPSKYPVLGAVWNATGSFYEFGSNQPMSITADKPISVTQFIMPGGSCGGASVGNDGTGDPEMILLSPIQQAINSATVFCPGFKDGTSGGTYINVIIPTAGVSSFSLDGKTGSALVDTGTSSYGGAPYGSISIPLSKAFIPHKGDPTYSCAMFHVTYPAAHTLSSSVPFNAIAYGTSKGESWGFNAGTAINNLSSVKIAVNPNGNDTSSSVVLTCKDNPVRLQIALPYLPSQVDSIVWSAPNNSNINLSGSAITGPYKVISTSPTKVQADTNGTIVVGGETFYLYTCPVKYQFSDYGFYPIVATAYGTFQSDCAGTDAQKIYVQVGSDNIDFKVTKAGCTSTNVTISDSSTAMAGASIVKWIWDLGDKSPIQTYTDTAHHNPTPSPYTYPALSSYTIKLTTINNLGCNSVDSFPINLAFGINAGFSKDNDTICPNATVTFTDTSSATADKRVWDFGEPSSGANNKATYTSATNPSHTYSTPGKHIITLQVFSGVCPSNVFTDSIYVASTPKPDFTFKGVCLPGSTTFTNTSDTATGFAPYSYVWYFGDSTNNIPNTATTTAGIHTYLAAPSNPNGYGVKLIATNRFGCVDSVSHNVATIYDKPKAIIGTVTNICFGDSTAFTDASIALKQTITNWNWDFSDLPASTAINPKHKFSGVNSYNVKLSITTKEGCSGDTTITVKINPLPAPSFVTPSSCFVKGGGAVTFKNTSTITDNTPLTVYWSYVQGGTPAVSASPDGDGQYTYSATGIFPVIQKATSSNGCSASDTLQFQIVGTRPQAAFTILNANDLCSKTAVQLQDASTNSLGGISRIDIIWDTVNHPTLLETHSAPAVNTVYSNNYSALPTDAKYSIRLIATCGSSCADTTKAQIVTVHGSPVITFADQIAAPCANAKPITFTTATETSGPTGGTWTYSGTGVNNANTTFDPSAVAGGTTSTITAVYSTPQWGCKDTAYSKINVKSIVDLSFNTNNFSMCKGTTDSLQLNPISKAGQTFAWTESDAPLNTISNASAQKPWVKPVSDSTVYTVTASNPAYCPSSPVSVTVHASPYPTLSIISPASKDTIICFGDTAKLAVAPKAASIVWTPVTGLLNSTSFSTIATPTTTTKYKVTVKDTFYCTKTTSAFVTVFVQPQFAIGVVNDLGNDSAIVVPGDSIRLHAFVVDSNASFIVTYKWTAVGLPSDIKYLSSSITSDPYFKPTDAVSKDNLPYIHYTVTATSKGSCHASTDYAVKVFNALPDLLVPTVFINNGRTRMLTPVPVGITEVLYFRVYNRMGQLVFSTTDLGKGWDGMINGSPADAGTYVWMAQGKDYKGKIHQPQTGTVILLR